MVEYHITLQRSGKSIVVNNPVSLLDTLQQHQIPLEYQCQQGYCGACRTELLTGEVDYDTPPLAYLQANEILPCCCQPCSDLILAL